MKIRFLVFFILIGLLMFNGCKSSDETTEYTLTVTLSEGVTGTPVAGTTSHAENDVVTYNYSTQSGYGDLTATLDGASIPASGTVTMTGNHSLNVTADIDLRGEWTGHFYAGWDSYFRASFSGGTLSGNVQVDIDVISGSGHGSFTVSGDQVEFTLQFPAGVLGFNGTIDSVNHLSGEWQIVSDAAKKIPQNGNWELDRD